MVRKLTPEDMTVQPVDFVSPIKWHLGHTTWFFEEMILKAWKTYKIHDQKLAYIFNSYYETLGIRIPRNQRGILTRPTIDQVFDYRDYVDIEMNSYLVLINENNEDYKSISELILLGINHEQQHQELMLMDMKYIFGHNPLFPIGFNPGTAGYRIDKNQIPGSATYHTIPSGMYLIGAKRDEFHYDNEGPQHTVLIDRPFQIHSDAVTNRQWLAFIEDGGYDNVEYWHSDGWKWKNDNNIFAPLYWYKFNKGWEIYTLEGKESFEHEAEKAVMHISYYEAFAYSQWISKKTGANVCLPTEQQWEAATQVIDLNPKRWEWTNSAYLPYLGFKKADGAVGEYNGKFMVNQMVLRGDSIFTPIGHSRTSYRNFFYPSDRWMCSSLRLVINP